MSVMLSVEENWLEIPEIEDGVERFIEVIGSVVNEETISFLTCVDMGTEVGMCLFYHAINVCNGVTIQTSNTSTKSYRRHSMLGLRV